MNKNYITKHRNPLKKWFITFPQCDLSREQFSDSLVGLGIYKVTTVQELHKDGNKHLHTILILKNKISKKKLLNYLKFKYPDSYKRIHIGSIRSMKASVKYLSKEDKTPHMIDKSIPSVIDIMYTNPFYWKKHLLVNKYKTNALSL